MTPTPKTNRGSRQDKSMTGTFGLDVQDVMDQLGIPRPANWRDTQETDLDTIERRTRQALDGGH